MGGREGGPEVVIQKVVWGEVRWRVGGDDVDVHADAAFAGVWPVGGVAGVVVTMTLTWGLGISARDARL